MTIPTDVLVALVALVVVFAIYFIEAAAYYRFGGWYYRTGPAVLRERWQTTADERQIREAIRPLLNADDLVGRESTDGFRFRQRTVSINAWTRILLRIENTERGVALHYEVRPFYGFAPLVFSITWLAAAAFGMRETAIMSMAGSVAFVFAVYKWLLPWDVARMGRLPTIRRSLAPHGLSVCERCGYDLFGLADATRCPECGSDNPMR